MYIITKFASKHTITVNFCKTSKEKSSSKNQPLIIEKYELVIIVHPLLIIGVIRWLGDLGE